MTQLDKITIIKNSEVLPSDGVESRLWRSGIYAKYFHNQKYNVTWVMSSFDHFNRINRANVPYFQGKDRFHETVVMLKTPGYKSNLSISRFFDHMVFGVKLFFALQKMPKPKIILCSYPTPESSAFAVLYGKLYNVPVIIDICDQWPDVLSEIKQVNILQNIIILPYVLMKKYVMKNAYSIMAATESFLEWGLKEGKRKRTKQDFVSYIPFETPVLTKRNIIESEKILRKINYQPGEFLICFAGTMGQMFEFNSLKYVVERAKREGRSLNVVLCGNGDRFNEVKSSFACFPNVFFPGYISSQTVFSLLQKSSVLLAPYKQMENFHDHLPNKFMEYSAAGKPIISSMQGLSKNLLEDREFGKTFVTGEELWEVIDQYFQDQDLVALHSKNALDSYRTLFDPKMLLESLSDHIKQMINDYDNT